MAVAHWLVGGMASSAGVKLNEDGTVAILTGVVDLSGASTSLAQITAEVLGVSLDDVHVRTADTDFAPHSTISAGSQALKSMGSAVLLAAREVERQIREVASDRLEANAGDLELCDNRVFVKGTPERSVTLREIGHLALDHKRGPIVRTQSVAQLQSHPALTTHAAEIEVDPDTGRIEILRYVAVQDVGTAINPLSVRGQIEGAVMQGLGQALSEACTFEQGRMTNPNLLDYKIFSSLDAPEVEVHLIEHPCASGPLGAKGVGEPPIIPPPAVIANAVHDALGVRIRELPITPEKVYLALKEKNRS
jgi:xanthine dehydrogenase molybdenum-binding subunit